MDAPDEGSPTTTWRRGRFEISTDRSRLDVDFVVSQVQQTYWASTRPRAHIVKSVEGSLCFGVYDGARQIGFARCVTDEITFAWLCDVIIAAEARGQGLGKWLIETIVARVRVKRIMLCTDDAHGLYGRFGFARIGSETADRWMERLVVVPETAASPPVRTTG